MQHNWGGTGPKRGVFYRKKDQKNGTRGEEEKLLLNRQKRAGGGRLLREEGEFSRKRGF